MRVRFVKRNDEYFDKYKIKTSLIEHDGILEFRKAPLTYEAYDHLLNMYNSQNKLIESFPLLKICSCKLLDNKEISFEYVEGKTLTEIISNAVDNGDKDKVLEILSLFKSLIYNNENICSFKMTDEFRNIFGDCSQFEGVEALKFTSLEILPNNIIFDGKDYVLIDYEWCVDFPVPIDILIYRFYNSLYRQNEKFKNILNDEEVLEFLTIKNIEMFRKLDELFYRLVGNEFLFSFRYRYLYSKNSVHIDKMYNEIEELQKSISWHEDRYKGLEDHKDFLNNQIEELNKSIHWYQERTKSLEDYLDTLNKQITYINKHPIKYFIKKMLKKLKIKL